MTENPHLTPPDVIAKKVTAELASQQSWPRRHVGLLITLGFVVIVAAGLYIGIRLFPPPPDAATMQQLRQLQQQQQAQVNGRTEARNIIDANEIEALCLLISKDDSGDPQIASVAATLKCPAN